MIRDLIKAAAAKHGLEPALVLALVRIESAEIRWAMRPEPRYRYLWDVAKNAPFRSVADNELGSRRAPADFPSLAGSRDQEWLSQATSWGLCLSEGTQVATADGWKPIETIGPGSRVLDRTGALSMVAAVSSREAECLDVSVGLNPSLRLTADHLVFARKSTLAKHNTGRRKVVTADCPEWMPASDLGEWDMLAMPVDSPTEDLDTLRLLDLLGRTPGYRDGTGYVEDDDDLVMRYRSGGRVRARVLREVVVDADLLELVGLYLAEGNALQKRKGAAFSFHERETHLHARVLDLFKRVFGVEPNYHIASNRANHSVQISVYGPAARWLTKLLPGNARTKTVPGWLLWLPPAKQVGLIRGMWLGDGCLGRGHYTTASPQLAYAMAHLLHRQGLVSRLVPVRSWFTVGLNSHDGVEGFKRATGLPVIWPQTANGRSRRTAVSWRRDSDFTYFPVRRVEPIGASRVFDLQVPSDSSFVAGRSVVHNCQVMGAVARERGFAGPYLAELVDPAVNLNVGCAHLAGQLAWANGAEMRALAAYNGGRMGNAAPPYRNADYALKVLQVKQGITDF